MGYYNRRERRKNPKFNFDALIAEEKEFLKRPDKLLGILVEENN